jgi:hypothetical protein
MALEGLDRDASIRFERQQGGCNPLYFAPQFPALH